ncbi:MAG: GatB/YqeY domain-containing protein [Ectothiorhodospiraceae bacterium]|nr:GatB/YqeY domain-containing protein [Ectothiorhodospiraceae bacterium]MCH8504206.1 GatB/YqeY domain-containing protein [Ectothiorhodospiraceae bacterium]
MSGSGELKTRITDAVKQAMRAGDKPRVATLRLITAAIKQREVDERIELDDDQIVALLSKQVKQRQESIQQYETHNRSDLADKERYEIGVLEEFLPQPLSDEEVEALIQDAIRETGASGMQDMGKVMGVLRPKLQGRADMGAASARVKALLGS